MVSSGLLPIPILSGGSLRSPPATFHRASGAPLALSDSFLVLHKLIKYRRIDKSLRMNFGIEDKAVIRNSSFVIALLGPGRLALQVDFLQGLQFFTELL